MERDKSWTLQQTELRRLVSASAHHQQALDLFLTQHAPMHSAAVSGGSGWSLADEALAGLAEEQLRWCPPKEVNSIAWLLWHITRIEDMTLTFLVCRQQQVLFSADWSARLGLDTCDCGAGMDERQVEDFSVRVRIDGLLDYRAAVGRSTRAGAAVLSAARLKEKVPAATVQQLAAEGSISSRAPWLVEFYLNRPGSFFLTRTATSHNYLHLNQARRLRDRLLKAAG